LENVESESMSREEYKVRVLKQRFAEALSNAEEVIAEQATIILELQQALREYVDSEEADAEEAPEA
jgi:hypothetical protein